MLPSQVFSYAKVYLGTGGNQFTGEPVHFSYIPDQVLEQAREVTIKLHSRAGRFLKLQLYFAARWIMLSEVIFESGKRKIDPPPPAFSSFRRAQSKFIFRVTFGSTRAHALRRRVGTTESNSGAETSSRIRPSRARGSFAFADALLLKQKIEVGGPENWNPEIEESSEARLIIVRAIRRDFQF